MTPLEIMLSLVLTLIIGYKIGKYVAEDDDDDFPFL
ncbi:hypothetical protein [Pectobacterium phage Jarilo]|uniref:Uncharacterized protein n=1 Tax=Pectobacterium phage Jarilo TaxID=2163634 RepID=A0A2S1GSX7_9CAUD|nr:hypothetical protein HOT17_gp10 [Pectobacterium phage Jarilo]AWD92491.1 hypothetical protein [Pectobacterium phage Jarilo]